MELIVAARQDAKVKDLRKQGLIPGIIYGKQLDAPIKVACKRNDLIKKYKEAGYSTPLTITGDGIDQLVLIQDIQLDPVSDILLHIDFLAVNKNEKVITEIPVKMIGECLLEKSGEGQIQLVKDFIEVKAFPQDLPHDITIDISTIQTTNDVIFVKDLKFSDKVEVLDDPEQAIVTVVVTVEEKEEEVVATVVDETKAAAPTDEAKDDKKEETK
ncbi:MAG: 50S ribosomal protein L25 [Candidatus Absconditabacterales bacterium]